MKAKKKSYKKGGKLLNRRIDRNMEKSFAAGRKVVERSDDGKEKKAKKSYRKLTKKALKTSKLIDKKLGASIASVDERARTIAERSIDQAKAFKKSVNTKPKKKR